MGKNFKSIDHVRCGPPPRFPRMCGTSLKTINNIIHKDLELDTRRKGKVHKLTPFHMKNRATNARKLYEEHLAGSRSEYTATLDEAWMYVTYCNGIRKICYIKRGNQVPDNWVHQCSETFPKGFMVVGVMTGRGVLPLIKVPSKVKVNSEFYIECVLKPVIEQLKDLYPGEMDKVFLHHDKASSHTSNKTQQFLQEMKDTLGLNFIRNSDIPVKSPDASPLDFYGFEGREDVNDEERAGRPSTSTTDEKINEVEKMILANRRITVREVAEDLNISIGSCHSIFINDLGMRRVAAKFVPKLLNCDQKQHRMNIANEMLDSVRDDPNLLQRVITGDEAWVYGYDVETKAQSFQWKLPHEPRPKKARQVRSNVKVLLTVFFDCRGVVHHEFLPQGRTVNKKYYLQVMRNLREAIRQKRPDLWKNKNWLLHHDNAPAHTLLLVRDFLTKNNTPMMPQPPYSPDLPPCDFFLFPKLKKPKKTASKEELKKILKNDFLKCFEDWKNRWHKCIISHWDYFEGNKIGIHE
ncbi:hypothetical protein LAZ67_3003977 [Cordylochernes scorpioides]|uniref:Transposase n=1 Tax=Cordylochernes scorpioides TaxID=51811 RepID=A0ABY6K9T4_9ARAC|nr:hypothetical protein LAZ67_3003977 [Cordylochernes scorpioides]